MEGGKILGLHSQQMLNTWSLAESTGIVGILHCQNLSAQNRLHSWLLLEGTDLGLKEDSFFLLDSKQPHCLAVVAVEKNLVSLNF